MEAIARRRYWKAWHHIRNLAAAVFQESTPEGLRAIALPFQIDLTQPADIYPPRTRSEWVQTLRMLLDDELAVLMGFASAGVLTDETDRLDRLLNASSFGAFSRDVFPAQPRVRVDDGGQAIEELAAALEHADGRIAAWIS